MGRILRQPYARKTGDRWLDESYVFCFQRQSVELLREVRRGFDREGLGDPLYDLPLGERPGDDIEMQVGVDGDLAAASSYSPPDRDGSGGRLDHAFAASHLLDVMPNPWRGSEVARRVFGALLERHARALVVSNYGFILEELHKRLEIERDRLPRDVFTGLLEDGRDALHRGRPRNWASTDCPGRSRPLRADKPTARMAASTCSICSTARMRTN